MTIYENLRTDRQYSSSTGLDKDKFEELSVEFCKHYRHPFLPEKPPHAPGAGPPVRGPRLHGRHLHQVHHALPEAGPGGQIGPGPPGVRRPGGI